MFVAAMIGILATLALALARALLGPTTYDRILAVNMCGTKTVLLIAVIGFLTGRPDFLDLALIYVMMNFIAVIAILRFIQSGHLAEADEHSGSIQPQ